MSTGERCEIEGSGYTTAERSKLMRHARTHTGERPYSCEVEGCGYTAAERSKLVRHAQRKHKTLYLATLNHYPTQPLSGRRLP